MIKLRNTGLLLLLLLCGFLSIQAQEIARFDNLKDFSRANPSLVAYLGAQEGFSSYTSDGKAFVELDPEPDVFYIYAGDFNDDGKPDVLFNFIDEHTANGDVQVRISSSLRLYYSSKEGYVERKVPQLNTNPFLDLRLLNVTMGDGHLLLDIQDYTGQIYHRHTALRYDADLNRFLISVDGGEGVFFPGSPYREIDPNALRKEMLAFINLADFDRYAVELVDIQAFRHEQPRKTVRVKTYREFLEALDNHTEIILDMDQLNLSDPQFKKELLDFKKKDGLRQRRVSYTSDISGEKPYALILSSYTDLTIRGEKMVEVISTVEDDEIIAFKNCEKIRIENLNFYHQVGVDPCSDGVSNFYGCKDVAIEHCFFNGSGIIGLNIQWSKNVQVKNSFVYNNSQHALMIHDSKQVVFEDCEFYANELQDHFMVQTNADVTIKKSNIHHNSSYAGFLQPLDQKSTLYLQNNRVEGNNFSIKQSSVDPEEYHLKTVRLNKENSQLSEKQAESNDFFQTDLKPSMLVRNAFLTLYAAEKRMKLEEVLNQYSYPVQQYWDKKQVSRSELEKIYQQAWSNLYFAENTIRQILQIDDNQYYLELDYAYRLVSDPEKLEEIRSVLKIELDDDGKIKSIQPEPNGTSKVKQINLLLDWANALNRKDMDAILAGIKLPLRYFEQSKEVHQGEIVQFYINFWEKYTTSDLSIHRIKPLTTDTYEVDLHYYFVKSSNSFSYHWDGKYNVVFDGDKIVELRYIE